MNGRIMEGGRIEGGAVIRKITSGLLALALLPLTCLGREEPQAASAPAPVAGVVGACRLVPPRTPGQAEPEPVQLFYSSLMMEYLPRSLRDRRNPAHVTQQEAQAMDEWIRGMRVAITRAPEHGTMVVDEALGPHPIYRPHAGFVGADRVEALVRARDGRGRPVQKQILVFIHLVSPAEANSLREPLLQVKYCGTTRYSWRIGGPDDPRRTQ